MGILGAVVFATPSVTTRGRADPFTEAFDRSIDARVSGSPFFLLRSPCTLGQVLDREGGSGIRDVPPVSEGVDGLRDRDRQPTIL